MNDKTAHTKNKNTALPNDNIATALVAGAAGFIGSTLCEALALQNVKVVALDNFISGHQNNLDNLQKKSNFEL